MTGLPAVMRSRFSSTPRGLLRDMVLAVRVREPLEASIHAWTEARLQQARVGASLGDAEEAPADAEVVPPAPRDGDSVRLEGTVLVTELSGSESTIHFQLHDETWVSQSHGIHGFEVGARADLFMDVGRCMYFGGDNRLVAA